MSSFLHIPVEIRCEIYHLLCPRRSVILRDELKLDHDGKFFLRTYLTGGTGIYMSLILIRRQIYDEVQSLHEYSRPSHLIFSKNLYALPHYAEYPGLLEGRLGIQLRHIAHMTFSVESCNKRWRVPDTTGPSLSGFLCDDLLEDLPPPYQLRKMYRFRNLFSQCLPALRQLHIYDVLQHGFERICNACLCARIPLMPPRGYIGLRLHDCAHKPLPNTRDLPFAAASTILHEALLTRYSEALPLLRPVRREKPAMSDYRATLDLLAHGVHIFLHDEVTVPFVKDDIVHNGRWYATFHLKPPKHAKFPAPLPTVLAQDVKFEPRSQWECLVFAYRPDSLHNPSFDHSEGTNTYYLSENRQFDAPIRTLPKGVNELRLRHFEHSLRLEFLDERLLPVSEDGDTETVGAYLQETNTDVMSTSIWQWDK